MDNHLKNAVYKEAHDNAMMARLHHMRSCWRLSQACLFARLRLSYMPTAAVVCGRMAAQQPPFSGLSEASTQGAETVVQVINSMPTCDHCCS